MSDLRRRILFVAAHLLYDAPNSGGDVLFTSIARHVAREHPEWELAVAAPAYAAESLRGSFSQVVAIPARANEERGVVRNGARIAATWHRRIAPGIEAVNAWRPDLVHSTGDFFPNVLIARAVSRAAPIRWSGVIHHINGAPFVRRNGLLTSTASFILQGQSFRVMRAGCERIALLNRDTLESLVQRGFERDRLRIVGAGIEPERFPFMPEPAESRRVLWVHRLEPTKGVDDLPAIAAMLPPGVQIDVVGMGPPAVRERLEAKLRGAGIADRVQIHGYVDETRLSGLYRGACAFISCSYEEGWGISLCEALAVGLPCLAYALPSHRDIFGDVVETVPLGDVHAFGAKLRAIVSRPDTTAERLRRRQRVESYTMAAAARRQAEIFADLLTAPRAPHGVAKCHSMTGEIAAAGHVTEVAGPVQALRAYLSQNGTSFAFARHPFAYTSLDDSIFEVFRNGALVAQRSWRAPKAISVLRDVVANFVWFGRGPRSDIFVGIDNVNAFCGIVLRLFGRTKTVVYYVIDYTPRRFDNRLFNALYHWVDRFAVRHADVVWNISERIAAVRRRQGLAQRRNKVVGVGVDLAKIASSQQQRSEDLVVVSHLTPSKGVQLAIEAMDEIVARVPQARLFVVGVGPFEGALRELASRQKSADHIIFTGLMDHEKLFTFLPTCGIAIAPYVDDPNSITYYADPTKPKEYLACGLPVIITDVPWIARFIENKPMGRCIPYERAALVEAAVMLISDRSFYARCRTNALAYARDLAWSQIYDRAFAEIPGAVIDN